MANSRQGVLNFFCWWNLESCEFWMILTYTDTQTWKYFSVGKRLNMIEYDSSPTAGGQMAAACVISFLFTPSLIPLIFFIVRHIQIRQFSTRMYGFVIRTFRYSNSLEVWASWGIWSCNASPLHLALTVISERNAGKVCKTHQIFGWRKKHLLGTMVWWKLISSWSTEYDLSAKYWFFGWLPLPAASGEHPSLRSKMGVVAIHHRFFGLT